MFIKNIDLGSGIHNSFFYEHNPEFYGFRRANGNNLSSAEDAGGMDGRAYYISASEASPTEYYVWGHYLLITTWPDSHYFGAVKIKKDYSLNYAYLSTYYAYTRKYVVRPFVKY